MAKDLRIPDEDAGEGSGPPLPASEGPAASERLYEPAPGELQLTVRAVAIGCLIGALVAAMNISFGLKTGWNIGGSLIAAILSYAFFAVLRPAQAFTPLETNIAQTAGSAAGSMTMTAGLAACIPALVLMNEEHELGMQLGYWQLTAWAAAVAWLGVFFAVPLRRQMVLVEKLRFPTGTATANTIVAMFGSGVETLRKARWLVFWGIVAAAFSLLSFFVPQCEEPPLHEWFPVAFLTVPAAYTFTFMVNPLLWGAGILVGMRVSLSLVVGGLIAWGVLAPSVESWGWVSGPTMSYQTGARGWILWPGVAIMVADALTSLVLSLGTIARSFRLGAAQGENGLEDPKEAIPNAWWMGGLAISSVLTVIVMWWMFHIPAHLTLIAIALSSILALIATRSTGETDINPISGVGKVTQLVYGAIAPKVPATNLLAAGITGAGASQAGDMMQDLKTGHLLGASPRKQLIAQLVGIVAGILVCVPIYILITSAYTLGSDEIPVPSAYAWKAMAEVLSEGFDAMPMHASWAVLGGALFGIAIPLLRRGFPKWRPFLPSGLAFGIAFIIPFFYSFCFLIGAVLYAIWKKRNRSNAEALGFAVASGLIAGDGLMGLVRAALTLLGLGPIT